jgi:hypothetical protein
MISVSLRGQSVFDLRDAPQQRRYEPATDDRRFNSDTQAQPTRRERPPSREQSDARQRWKVDPEPAPSPSQQSNAQSTKRSLKEILDDLGSEERNTPPAAQPAQDRPSATG